MIFYFTFCCLRFSCRRWDWQADSHVLSAFPAGFLIYYISNIKNKLTFVGGLSLTRVSKELHRSHTHSQPAGEIMKICLLFITNISLLFSSGKFPLFRKCLLPLLLRNCYTKERWTLYKAASRPLPAREWPLVLLIVPKQHTSDPMENHTDGF